MHKIILPIMLSVFLPMAVARAESSPDAAVALQVADSAPARGVYVNTSDGIVLLYGRPATPRVRPGVGVFAVNAVVAVPSVARELENTIVVPAPVVYVQTSAEDDSIQRGVEQALRDLDAQANSDIHVRVEDGVVWLSGTVPSWQGHAARFHATRSVAGVRSIFNRLRPVPVRTTY